MDLNTASLFDLGSDTINIRGTSIVDEHDWSFLNGKIQINLQHLLHDQKILSRTIDEFSAKHKLKAELKAKVKYKFKVGDYYMLRTKSKCGSRAFKRVYQIKQIIWCINELPVSALVVKQLSGPCSNLMTMNLHDCHRMHVKYEPGLQVLSMDLNWVQIKNYNEQKQ